MTPSVADGQRAAPAPVAIATAALQTPIGTLRLYGGPRGLLTLALPNEARAATAARLQRLLGPVAIAEDAGALAAALAQVADYFGGGRRSFDLALDPRGTPFQRLVWEAVARVPYGETRTYGEIARAIGRPAAGRAVGRANGANPLPLLIPCHRIVGAGGALTGYGGGLATKRRLLALERGQPVLV
jgi:O-6-methylguanine DNA methyltransferase